MRILETQVHADHVSGRGRLAAATGAAEHAPLGDGEALELGDVRIRALATPGHRPEHLAYVEQLARHGLALARAATSR